MVYAEFPKWGPRLKKVDDRVGGGGRKKVDDRGVVNRLLNTLILRHRKFSDERRPGGGVGDSG